MSLISFFLVAKHAAEGFTQHDALDVIVALLSFLFDVNVLQIELIWLLFYLNDYIFKKELILVTSRKRFNGTSWDLKGPQGTSRDLKGPQGTSRKIQRPQEILCKLRFKSQNVLSYLMVRFFTISV